MKRLFVVLVFVLVFCSLFSACEKIKVMPAPSVSSSGTPALTPKPTPAATLAPTSEDEEFDYEDIDKIHEYLLEYYADQIEEAEKYRITVGDTEYYFDTSTFLDMYYPVEFPLYRLKDGDFPEYLGTTGFAFQVFGDYIYVQSDPLQEDWPDSTLTRVINLKDLSVTPAGRDMYIFTPKEGNKVYYTYVGWDYIYIADASLKNVKELHIEIPDQKTVEKKVEELCGYDASDLISDVSITDVKDGWIYFTYWLWEYEGSTYYEGNYRIKTDGSKIQPVGEGKFGDEIEYEEG